MTNGEELAIIYRLIFVTELQPRRCREMEYLEWYRSGHNEHDWKSCDGQKPSEGSNPSHSAKKTRERIAAFSCFFGSYIRLRRVLLRCAQFEGEYNIT